MKALMDAGENEIMFYIHGFNNQPDEVFSRADAIQKQLINAGIDYMSLVPVIY